MRLGGICVVGLTHLGQLTGDTALHGHRVLLDDRCVLHHLMQMRLVGERIPVLIRPAAAQVGPHGQDTAARPRTEERRAIALPDLLDEPIPVALVPILFAPLHPGSPLTRTLQI